jgi:membrane protease YdiL (CAAX protease family)
VSEGDVTPAVACRTCGTPYVGAYCAVCGQARAEDRVLRPDPLAPPGSAAAEGTDPAVANALRLRSLRAETLVVMAAFWLPVTLAAVVALVQSHAGDVTNRFPTLVTGHPLENMIVSCLAYLATGAAVPVTLLLLVRSGETARSLGVWPVGAKRDALPAVGLAVGSFVIAVVVLLILYAIPGVEHLKSYTPGIPRLPAYYVIEGLVMSAVTAVAEETVMNGFLVTRLEQVGMRRGAVFASCAVLRMCYHSYYGWGMVVTVPFTLIMTADFIVHRRLARVIGAHFVYDFTLITIAILH